MSGHLVPYGYLRAPRPAASAPPQPAESTTPRVDEPQRGDGEVVIPATSPPAAQAKKEALAPVARTRA